jgi:hypothetical protein
MSPDAPIQFRLWWDDFSWEKGKHSLTFGTTFKRETPNEFAAENFNFVSVGVTGNTNFTTLSPAQAL